MKFVTGAILGLTALAVLTGCSWHTPCGTPEETAVFRMVTSHLDQDASEYVILSGAVARKAWLRNLENIEHFNWAQKNAAHDRKLARQRLLTEAALYTKLTGLSDVQGFGISSKTLARNPYGQDFIHSKIFMALPDTSPGLLNTLFDRNNIINIKQSFGELPQNTGFAAAAAVTPETAMQILKNSGAWGENTILTLADQFPLEQLLKNVCGIWQFVVLDDRDNSFMIKIPDNNKVLLKISQSGKSLYPGTKLVPGKNSVTLYNSAAAEQIFTGQARSRMGDRGDFAMLTGAMPDNGVGYIFQAHDVSIAADFGLNVLNLPDQLPVFITVSRTNGGIAAAANGCRGAFETLLHAASAYICRQMNAGSAPETKPETPVKTALPAEPDTQCHCQKLLMEIKNLTDHSPRPGNAGLLECFQNKLPESFTRKNSCSIIYFGKNSNPDMPLAFSSPGTHNNHFTVLFNNGKIEKYQLAKADSCRRIVSFLHTVKRYNENDLQKLMRLAAQFDQNKN